MYEAQKQSRARKLKEGWKRVEAFLDPDAAKDWDKLSRDYEGPTDLIKAALSSLKRAKLGKACA